MIKLISLIQRITRYTLQPNESRYFHTRHSVYLPFPAIFKEILPGEYLSRFTDEHIREDGRGFDEARPIKAIRKNEVCLLSVGQTLVMANIEISIQEDKLGNTVVTAQKPLLEVEVKFNTGQQSSGETQSLFDTAKQEYFYSELIQNYLLKNFKNLHLTCLIAKEVPNKFWNLKLNLRVVNNGGNILDALILAAQFELFSCQVNEVALTTIDGALTIELVKERKRYLQFNPEDFLFPVTCSQLEGGHVIAVDPSSFEETHSLANVQVLLALGGNNRSYLKLGGKDLTIEAIEAMEQKAEYQMKAKTQKIQEILKNHSADFVL